MAAPMIVIPGQRIGKVDGSHAGGQGTYQRSGFIYSSLLGYVNERKSKDDDKDKVIYDVLTKETQTAVPSVGSIVTARVTNVNPRFCKCNIINVDNVALRESFRGMIRKEDVRSTEKDKVEMYKCYRPGDIILAKVLSLGDAHSYLLTTADNCLGVVVATSEAGVSMVPISWCEMQCPKTSVKENRKVAKVQPEYLQRA